MENEGELSFIEFVENVRYYWSVETVSDFLRNKLPHLNFEVDTCNSQGKTVLELLVGKATRHSSREKLLMCLLLEHGANPLKECGDSGTIMKKIFRSKDSELIINFLKHVEDVNMLHGECTALVMAVRKQLKDVVEYLIDRNVDINMTCSLSQHTALHEAVRGDNCDITKILLEKGADIEARDITGQTPMHWALGGGASSFDQLRILIANHADVNSRDLSGRTPLHTHCSEGLRTSFEICELLIQKITDINATDVKGATALHCLMRYSPVSCLTKNKKLMSLFLNHGGNLNKLEQFHGTVLHTAAVFNHPISFLVFLIEKGADASILNAANRTFMDCLIRSSQCEILKYLLVREIQNVFEFNQHLKDEIRSDQQIFEFEISCRGELGLLKHEQLKDNDPITLLTVLTAEERVLAKFFSNDKSRTKIADLQMKKFPIFGTDLEKNFKIGLSRYNTEVSLFDFLMQTSQNILDRDSFNEIVKVMSTEEINHFNKLKIFSPRLKI